MRHRLLTLLIGLSSLVILVEEAGAGLPDFRSRTIESENGVYVLVLLTPMSERISRKEHMDFISENYSHLEKQERIDEMEQELALEEKYPASGLYANNGSEKLLWKFPYISTCQDIYVANDGMHLVIMYSPWNGTCSGTYGLSFYRNGRSTRSYSSLFDFLPFTAMRLALNVCLRFPMPEDGSYVRAETSEFVVYTNQDDRIVFDLLTGACLKRSSPAFLLCYIQLAIVAFSFWSWFRWGSSMQKHERKPDVHGLKFSMKALFAFVTYLSCSLMVVKLYGWFGGAFVLVATVGASIAGFRRSSVVSWCVGGALALYGVYFAALLFAVVDDLLTSMLGGNLFFEWDQKWWFCVPLALMIALAIFGAWIGRRILSIHS